jgi:hypothetical protein
MIVDQVFTNEVIQLGTLEFVCYVTPDVRNSFGSYSGSPIIAAANWMVAILKTERSM